MLRLLVTCVCAVAAATASAPEDAPLNLWSGVTVGLKSDDASVEKGAGEQYQFQADVNKLMDIIINSLYSKKEIFLRELISNGSDALDKVRFMSLTDSAVLGEGDTSKLEMKLIADKEAKTLTLIDRGCGMSKEDLINHLGTVAQSGTSSFIEAFQQGGEELGRGTKIVLTLKEDCLEFLEEERLKGLIKRYSEFINFPIYLYTTKEEEEEVKKTVSDWELVNDAKALWTRNPSDITDDEYKSFYQSLTKDVGEPLTHTHFSAEGEVEFKSILYIPKEAPYDLYNDYYKKQSNLKLYVRRVMITDEFDELLPRYLGFIKGVVDSDSLPLNVSREMLQQNKAFGKYIKMGLIEDAANRTRLAKLLRYATSKSGDKEISLEEYVANMKEEQKNIYYISGEDKESLLKSPSVEKLLAMDYEIIFMTDSEAPYDLYNDYYKKQSNLKLYVRRVMITDEFDELLPRYLGFIKGVVDSDSLPLNVSREMLQQNKAFGKYIKMGLIEDAANRTRLAKLLRYATSKSGDKEISLEEYVANMKEEQKNIYYISGEDKESLLKSPSVEKLLAMDYEIIFMTDSVQHLTEFEGKRLINASREGLKLEEGDKDKRREELYKDKFKPLTDYIKETLGKKVEKVMISKHLVSSPVVALSADYGWTAQMEKVMKSQAFSDQSKFEFMKSKRNFGINPRHPMIVELNSKIKDGSADEATKDSVLSLYLSAVVAAGYQLTPEDAVDFSTRVASIVSSSIGVAVDAPLEPEIEVQDDVVEEEEGEEEEEAEDMDAEESTDKDEV
ncbi:hypothetical protein EMIHUDRAFT_449776 [Emiliania huxleyi CCMP1516]|uniref:Histidine kinase/HSP90-like ATPase domain-containing protein n=2 Tax=Emiliania huxleyi TaxID=2903 RepID=A0A0D3K2Z2_EMIH1|nr:hypothetical protein EMIHUDRAFT_449776 [Emiliania huxleyi CCMP1516]EOD30127.1 hypothetical protein EMIHUDRAFT_449776 [Emiliania huxleyi CCMP1516]|eukprot:XP_005782556.1 hypothetical protein EMIHUDRAFT_449776 [Emiliania huxleyi CCMP1516]